MSSKSTRKRKLEYKIPEIIEIPGNSLASLATPLSSSRTNRKVVFPSVKNMIPFKPRQVEERMVQTLGLKDRVFNKRITDSRYDFLKEPREIVQSSFLPTSQEYETEHFDRLDDFIVNPPARSTPPTVISITALCLCHADINIQIVKKIDNKIDEEIVMLDKKPTILEIDDVISVQYGDNDDDDDSCKFEFKYTTVPFTGLFSNVGSCTGMPVVKMPNEIFSSHDMVEREKEFLMGYWPDPHIHGNNFMLVCSPYVKNIPFEEIQSSTQSRSDCLSLVLHENFECKSLLSKTYQSRNDETMTISNTPSLYDAGKIILLIKIQYEEEPPFIIKTIILGPGYEASIIELLGILHKPSYINPVEDGIVFKNGSEGYQTTTDNIIDFINHIKDEDTSIKFVDTSCNMIDGMCGNIHKPFVLSMLLKIKEYFTEMRSRQEGVHGGKKRFKQKHKTRKNLRRK